MEVKNPVIFVSYSHKDKDDLIEVRKFINSINTNFKFDIWEDTRLKSGDFWQEEIEQAIAASHIAVLLISIDFLVSDFIKTVELPLLLENKKNNKLVIFCVLIRSCTIELNPHLSKVQIFNKNFPLKELSQGEREKQLTKLAGEIYELCNKNHFTLKMNEEEIMSSHLPSMSSPFFGKKSELSELRDLILEKEEGVITLHGMGGIGKTRFAVEIALSLTNHFEGGCHFIELEKHDTLVGFILAITEALNISPTYQDNGIETINKLLQRKKPSLLILDNFEQLNQIQDLAKNTIELWRRYNRHIVFIITSRTSLQIEEELVYTIMPLYTKVIKFENVEQIKDSDSFQLFNYYANRSQLNRKFSSDDIFKIGEIIKLLEGHPKAIMLVAKQIAKLGVNEVLRGLKKKLLLGKEGDYFKNAIDLSFGLLNEEEKLVFTCSCIFQDGFDLKAAEQIIPIENKSSIIHHIYQLSEHSLLNFFEIRDNRRFSMYRPLKEYGQLLLDDQSDNNTKIPSFLGLRYIRYYLSYAEKWNSLIFTSSAKLALDNLEKERENILYAHLWALEAGEIIIAAKIIIAYAEALAMRGPWEIREIRIQETLDKLSGNSEFIFYEVQVHLLLSKAYWGKGNNDSALNSAEIAVKMADNYNKDNWLIGISLFHKAIYLSLIGKYTQSSTLFIRCSDIFKSINDDRNAALCTAHVGNIHKILGNYEIALGFLYESEKKLNSMGDIVNQLNCINWLGLTLWHMGLNMEAVVKFKEAIKISRELRNMIRLGGCLTNLGLVLLDMENYKEAIKKFEEADTIHSVDGHKGYLAVNLGGWGYALSFLGYKKVAFEKVELAIKYSEEANSQSDITHHYTNLGNMHWNNNDYYKAKESIISAISLQKSLNENYTRRYLFNLIYLVDIINKTGNDSSEIVIYIKEIKYLIDKLDIKKSDPSPKMNRALNIFKSFNF